MDIKINFTDEDSLIVLPEVKHVSRIKLGDLLMVGHYDPQRLNNYFALRPLVDGIPEALVGIAYSSNLDSRVVEYVANLLPKQDSFRHVISLGGIHDWFIPGKESVRRIGRVEGFGVERTAHHLNETEVYALDGSFSGKQSELQDSIEKMLSPDLRDL